MAQPSPPIQTIGPRDDEPDDSAPERSGALGLLLISIVLLLSVVALGSGSGGMETESVDEERRLDSSLLHDLGGPVDAVEQFMTALSYGQTEVVAAAVAADADVIELPLLSAPAEQIASTMATFQDIGGVIQMFGCSADSPAVDSAAVGVTCSVAYTSDFIRHLDSPYLRGTMDFLVVDGLVGRVRVEMESPLADKRAFDRWLIDFYAERLAAVRDQRES